MPQIIGPFETSGFSPNYPSPFRLKLAHDLPNVIANDIRRTSREHCEEIGVNYSKRVLYYRLQLLLASENDLLLGGVGAGHCVTTGITRALAAILDSDCTPEFLAAAGPCVQYGHSAVDGQDGLQPAETANVSNLLDDSCVQRKPLF